MERIGIAASKMAKGNLCVYNLWVILISFMFSLLVFFVVGSAIFVAFVLISYATHGLMPVNFEKEWISMGLVCMISLTMVVGLFCLIAILRNIKFHKS